MSRSRISRCESAVTEIPAINSRLTRLAVDSVSGTACAAASALEESLRRDAVPTAMNSSGHAGRDALSRLPGGPVSCWLRRWLVGSRFDGGQSGFYGW